MKNLQFLLLIFSSMSFADGPIKAGLMLLPPHVLLDETTTECIGSAIEVTTKILSEAGLELHVFCAPARRIYQMMQDDLIDLTINAKNFSALPDHIVYLDPPYRNFSLTLYSHKNIALKKDIAAIKDFHFHGQRVELMQQGYEFLDMPTNISAIQMFLKKQSSHLLNYISPVEYYAKAKHLNLAENISSQYILDVGSHYAISGRSAHSQKLQNVFNEYAKKHKLTFFSQILAK